MEFQISGKAKKSIITAAVVGLILFLVGVFTNNEPEYLKSRVISNFLIDSLFFLFISLGALFFLALQYATETGWSVAIKRVLEGVSSYVIIGAITVCAVFAYLSFTDGGYTVNDHGHHVGHVYEWMDHHMVENDAILQGKSGFLNKTFFWGATIVYFAIYLLFYRGFRKRSLQEDLEGGTKLHFKNFAKAALFLVLFGYTSSTFTWHWIMSIDAHWFSTLYGWYVFSGMWLTAMVCTMLLIMYLKGKGHLEKVNDSHIHDLGKWIFALSFLWSYLFFSQFMLYWYANMGEEVVYYLFRFENYKVIFWGMFIINFTIPMLILMSREAKRHAGILIVVCLIIIVGHWTDVYMLITPGVMGEHGKIGIIELGLFLVFASGFVFWVLNTLTKAPLMPKNHPYLDESKHHEI
ncbi:quinol:cytochrome C oxidoreductase [Putridiphycobacter roseus]|uniref:Quinol:cytochrome C oxidoreductase n=1 Tax=Putridiphycobacter roseus TaxID=2219161 RepID=A0A2W1NM23_9FLAO|nr:quinol:cytochrome C oxidoreductase [Putridiphycobacter roseus]PZE18906.1 quinol:cytochrome C oxidoreductase [Putridiphycobacter roseus]